MPGTIVAFLCRKRFMRPLAGRRMRERVVSPEGAFSELPTPHTIAIETLPVPAISSLRVIAFVVSFMCFDCMLAYLLLGKP